jgi:hypothetical protein
MKIKSAVLNPAATLCVTALTILISTSFCRAGGLGFAGFRVIDAATARVSPGRGGNDTQPIVSPGSSSGGTAAARHGTDDPAGHDAGDDRGRGRGRGRGR